MKKVLFLATLAIFLFAFSAFAQNQAGSERIAEQIRGKNDDANLDGASQCVANQMKIPGNKIKDAQNFCLKAMNLMRRTSEHIASEAAEAAQPDTCCGAYGYNGGWGGMWAPGGGYNRYWSDSRPAPAPSAQQIVGQQNAYATEIRGRQDEYAAQVVDQQNAYAASIRERQKK